MSANGTRTIIWRGGETVFCLGRVGDILDLEDKCKAGIAGIALRLESNSWHLNDVRETIRLGLIGGGMSPERAVDAVRNHVDAFPLMESVLLAYEIIKAVLVGVPDDPVGDQKKEMPPGAVAADSSIQTAASAGLN